MQITICSVHCQVKNQKYGEWQPVQPEMLKDLRVMALRKQVTIVDECCAECERVVKNSLNTLIRGAYVA